jgi:tRNA nucleotidyltransferase/poly(A) polymerase
MSDPLDVLVRAAVQAWLVGGALRDRLAGRPTSDYDVVVAGDAGPLARSLGRQAGGHAFRLSERFGVWRVVSHDHDWDVDLIPLAGKKIEQDLAQRDFTINAIAQPLSGGELVDPYGGAADLAARRLRMVAAGVFESDALRVLRLARIACELDFAVDGETLDAARASAPGLARVASERVFSELKRIVADDRAVNGFELLAAVGATEIVLPELAGLRGVEQNRFHHLDVHDHTLEVLEETIRLERGPREALGEHAEAVRDLLAEPFANRLTRGHALRFGALFHDSAKPQTRGVTDTGRITFFGHDQAGAELAAAALRRLRASERLVEHVAALTRNHLRLGFLVHQMPLSRRDIYHYMRACDPVQVDVTLLSIADRLATRGDNADAAIARHLELADQLLGEALAWTAHPPRPPVTGNELARALDTKMPGPEIGRILAALEEASFAGEVTGREDALALAHELYGRSGERG